MIPKKLITPFYERLALVLVGIISLSYLVILGREILSPLLFGFLFAVLLLPVSYFFEKKCRFPRSASSFTAILLLVGGVSMVVYLIGAQISRLGKDWPMLKTQIEQSVTDVQMWIQNSFHINADKQMSYVHNTTEKIMESGTTFLGTTFGAVSSLLLFYVFILIFTFFILFYRRLLLRFVIRVFQEDHSTVVIDIVQNAQRILRQYILGLMLEMVVVASLACAGFWFIDIKYAVLLGILVGLFNIIPYIGIFSALLLSTVVTFATGTLQQTVFVAIGVTVIHIVDSNFLLPTIVGSKVRLNALITFIGILIGEMMWGLSGMFLSIPVIAVFKIIFDRIETLKPWGYLLGGDYEYSERAKKRMKTE
ncbi:AI-2E family transporter [Mucilaginibacter hurinus]|uniref:AI-2E family transporter n=1 Tax=Mucilaginibacter hurinus TaxID=2201324 RepID=A0A367GTK8_9SPHI|nr:AI-2E family transporter [Mucilaginibacter hurinus]RCH56620.1 AI-2E family transporter [Mucilaginibacter hurinus]